MPSPVSKPSTGILWYKGKGEELAPFDVTVSGNRDYVLLLVQNNKAVRSYYIRHGETLSVLVPLGTYQVYYACATIHSSWYGRTDLWKSQTEYYKSQESLDFELNCTPFVRQYGILFRKWGVFVCQRDNESTTERRR